MQSSKVSSLVFQEQKDLELYSLDGKVVSLKTFITENDHLLSPFEKKFLQEELKHLDDPRYLVSEDVLKEKKKKNNKNTIIETLLTTPFSRTKHYFNGKILVPASRGGVRSAYINGTCCKIKGCRPEEATFPHWKVDPHFNLIIEKIPFGVLTPRAVLAELLAFLFMKKYAIDICFTPLAIFHYLPEGKDRGYALLQESMNGVDDARAESFIDCSSLSVHDIVRLVKKGRLKRGKEITLWGIDNDLYIEKKVALLLEFHYNGGFRGILNSNIGNDVISNNHLYTLCDFDTFILQEIPRHKHKEEIRSFIIAAFLELIKTSLPFIDYLHLHGENLPEIHKILAEYYRTYSSLYARYVKEFMTRSTSLSWDQGWVQACIDEAFQTPIAFELLQELIPNSHTFRSYNYDFVYVPHH